MSTAQGPSVALTYSTALAPPAFVLAFNGATSVSHVFAGSATDSFPPNELTLAFWICTSTTNANAVLVSYTANGAKTAALALTNPVSLTLTYQATTSIVTGVAVNDGVWHHVLLTISSSGSVRTAVQLLLDGVAVYQSPNAFTRSSDALFASAGALVLGLGTAGTGLTGNLSEFQLWDGPLSHEWTATLLQRRAPSHPLATSRALGARSISLALGWGLFDAESTGTLVGADPSPFVPSTLRFRTPAPGNSEYVQASWAPVADAISYELQLYAANGSLARHFTNLAATTTAIEIDGIPLGRTYYARVRAETASGPGSWSTPVALVPIDLANLSIAFNWPSVTGACTAAWPAADQAQAYLVLQTRDPSQSQPAPTQSTNTSIDVTADLTGDYGWNIGVQALAGSSIGPACDVSPVAAPAMTFYYLDDGSGQQGAGSFEFAWLAPSATPDYQYFQVLDGSTPIATVLMPGGQTSPFRIPSTKPAAIGDQLTGVLRMLGSGAITHLATRSVTAQQIGQPQLIWQIASSPKSESLAMGWGTAASNATYNVTLTASTSNTPIVSQPDSTSLSFTMTPYVGAQPPASYTLVVAATSEGQVGPPSTVVTPPAPGSSLQYESPESVAAGGVLNLSWTATPTAGLSIYLRIFLNGATAPAFYAALPFNSGACTVPQPPGGYPEGTQLSYEVYALGEGCMAAPETGSVIIHTLAAPVVRISGDAVAVTLTANWRAVNPELQGVSYGVTLNGTRQGALQTATSFDLTSILAAPEATTILVGAQQDNSFSHSSDASPAPAVTPLLRYDYLPNNGDTLSAIWSHEPVDYIPLTYIQVQPQGQSLALKQLNVMGEEKCIVPKPTTGFAEGTVYTIQAKCISSSTVGVFTSSSITIHQLAAPAVTFAQATDPSSVTAQWNDIRNSQQQNVVVAYQVCVKGQAQGSPQPALACTLPGLLDRAGVQVVTVQGQANGSYGAWSSATQLARPSAPTLAYDEDTGILTVSWPAVSGQQHYYANVVDARGQVLARSWVDSANATVTASFSLSSLQPNTTYSVNVRSMAGGTLTSFATSTFVYALVPGPSVVQPLQVVTANNQIVASWLFDAVACGFSQVEYAIELHDAHGNLVGSPVTTASHSATLNYPPGTPSGTLFQVRVRATCGGLLGIWSDYAPVVVGALSKAALSGFAFSADNAMTLSWGAVQSPQLGTAVTYSVNVTGPGLKSGVFPLTTASTSVTLPQSQTGVTNQQTYTATVQATAPGTPGPVSDSLAATSGTLQPADPGTNPGKQGGDPISMATGAYLYSNTEISVTGVVPLEFITYYASSRALPGSNDPIASDKPLGKRWNHIYHTRLYIPDPQPASNPYVAVVWGNGVISTYNWRNSIGPFSKQGRQDGNVFQRNADLSFTLILKYQARYNFSRSGQLTAIVSAVGNIVTLSYDGSRLSRVTDSGSGRFLTFDYFSSGADAGRLQQVSDGTGRGVSFRYEDGDLRAITNPRGKSRTFTYWPQSLLKQANYENGDVIVYNEYNSQQQVTLQKDGNQYASNQGQYKITWSTGTGPNNLATTIATVVDADGNSIVYTSLTESQNTVSVVYTLPNGNVRSITSAYDGHGNLWTETTYEGPPSGIGTAGNSVTVTYDGNFNVASLTWSGGLGAVAFSYDDRNNLTGYTDLLGNRTTATFNPDNTLAQTQDPLGTTTLYTYKPGPIKGLAETVSVYLANGQGSACVTANLTQMKYSGRGQLESVMGPAGSTTTFNYYDETGWLALRKVANADGLVTLKTAFAYDSQSGQVGTISTQRYDQPDTDPSVETITYDDRGNVHVVTDASGRTTEYRYNASNFLQAILYPPENGFSNQTSFGYTGNNLINTLTLSTANPAVVWKFTYDPVGRLSTRTDPNGNLTQFAYTMNLDPLLMARTVIFPQLVNPSAQYVQSMMTDAFDRPVGVSDIALQGAAAGNTVIAYATQKDPSTGANALQVTRTLPLTSPDQKTPYTSIGLYDALNREISVTDPAGNAWKTTMSLTQSPTTSAMQNVATTTDSRGRQMITVTDDNGRVFQRMRGRPAAGAKPAKWLTTTFEYDSSGNPVSIVETGTDGVSLPATKYSYAYNVQKHVLEVTVTPYSDSAATSVYSYDKTMQYVGLVGPAGVAEARTYNSRGLLKTFADARGNTLRYDYDAAGRFTTTTLPGGDVIAHVLDQTGNRLQTTRNGSAEITRAFDVLNRLSSRTDNLQNQTVAYTYTPMNRVKTLLYPGVTKPVTYHYDGLHRLKSVTDWSNRVTSYTYYACGQVQSATHPNGVASSQTVNDVSGVTAFGTSLGGAWIATRTTWLDTFYRPKSSHGLRPIGANTLVNRSFTYAGDRMLTASGVPVTYDPDGNMATLPDVEGTLTYNELRQLIAVGNSTLTYDLDGLHTQLVKAGTSRIFVKDTRNYRAPLVNQADPVQAVGASAAMPSAAGPLVLAPLPAVASITQPLRPMPVRPPTLGPEQPDLFESLPALDYDAHDRFDSSLDRTLVAQNSDGTGRVRYVYGVGLISREEDSGLWQSYVFDSDGSTLALVDSTGNITDRFAYDLYGEIVARAGATEDPFLYHGRYGVAQFGIGPLLMRFRAYQPALHRFTSRDFLYGNNSQPQTQNRYSFVFGNPLLFVDPLGLGGDQSSGNRGSSGPDAAAIVGGVLGTTAVAASVFAALFGLANLYGPALMAWLGTQLAARFGGGALGRLGTSLAQRYAVLEYTSQSAEMRAFASSASGPIEEGSLITRSGFKLKDL